ncbi:MAG: ectoine/hydroxyectoine ABC transporter permease subunit EhuD [Alphaproteobacteria bacterium]|nr:ectoine/hydroxyectoine ABC transporter permease subunit EhuD [Alphaproteobacteria bacterium]MDA7987058.1 ectoine/hydroxyectoine ABC transporter permease subunit EhuD [Alphaproteobacteria bacterium]MDA8000980.1 ectoine/hydroxyectoine ABC transporter permease subunit EhuD [Alphaproteobacteria bacterium]MDA8004020.1 ectoine/hydroxyectoine ABC transporter permease subunit EhuD [Alphaproteobacteria bacterium]MDA8006135.1 ectoine/hydroxyectoine ABC transporter permease subunit EhuD [Alphaproteobac
MDWRWDFTFDVVLPQLWAAAGITVYATVVSFLLALVGGLVLMTLKVSKNPVVSFVAGEFIEFIRSTPLLVQIFFLFFVLPEFGITLPPLTTGILAIALYNSSLCAEVYRAGLLAIPRGQYEAAVALNMSPRHAFRRVIMPQSLPPIVPALGNYLIAIFKETPLLSFVAVGEIMHASKLIGSEYYRFTEAITIAGIFFLVMSLVSAQLVRAVEQYVNRSILH